MADPLSIPVDEKGELIDLGEKEKGEVPQRKTAVEKAIENREAAVVKKKTPKGAGRLERLLPDAARVRFEKVRGDGKIAIVGREYSVEEVELAGGIKALLEKHFIPKYGGGEYIPILIGVDGTESPRNSMIFEDPVPVQREPTDPDRLVATIFDKLEAQREAEERRQRERDEERRRFEEAQRKRDEEFNQMMQTLISKGSDGSSNMMLMFMLMKQMSDSQAAMMQMLDKRRLEERAAPIRKEDIAELIREEIRRNKPVELPELHGLPTIRDDDDKYTKLLETLVEMVRGSERLTLRDIVDIMTKKSSDDPAIQVAKLLELAKQLQPQTSPEISELRNTVIELTKLIAAGRSGNSDIEQIATTMEKVMDIAGRFSGKGSSTVETILQLVSILSESEVGKAIATKIKASAAKDAVLARQMATQERPSEQLQKPKSVESTSNNSLALPKVFPAIDSLNAARTDEDNLNSFIEAVQTLYSDPSWRPRVLQYLTVLRSTGKNGLAGVAEELCQTLVDGGLITRDKAKHIVSLVDKYKDKVWQALGGSSQDSQESSKDSEKSNTDSEQN